MESSGTGRSAWKSSVESQLLLLFLDARVWAEAGGLSLPSQSPRLSAPLHTCLATEALPVQEETERNPTQRLGV